MKPKLLDLFCKAGGAGMGYHRAGFEVVGVDIEPQRRYPFTFVKADALAYAAAHGYAYDAIHASPPCQAHSIITPKYARDKHVDLIPHTRWMLESLGLPYVIENVAGARDALRNPIMLCGSQFGLKVYRHRLFESNVFLFQPEHYPHRDNTPRAGHGVSSKGVLSVTSGGQGIKPEQLAELGRVQVGVDPNRRSGVYGMSEKGFIGVTGHFTGVEYARFAMGIDWMTQDELAQAVPPAYTEWIGRQLIQVVRLKNEETVST